MDRRSIITLAASTLAAAGLYFAGRRRVVDVRLRAVTREPVLLRDAPDAVSPGRSMPSGIVVVIDKRDTAGWYRATVPAATSDVLFDLARDTSGWIPEGAVEDVVKEQ